MPNSSKLEKDIVAWDRAHVTLMTPTLYDIIHMPEITNVNTVLHTMSDFTMSANDPRITLLPPVKDSLH